MGERFSMITTEPSDDVKKIHDRMPLVFEKEEQERWLGGDPVERWMDEANYKFVSLQITAQ